MRINSVCLLNIFLRFQKDVYKRQHLVPVMTSLKDMREAILTSDAWRSFFIIVIAVSYTHLRIADLSRYGKL